MRKRIQRLKAEQVKKQTNDKLQGKRVGKVRVWFNDSRAFEVYRTK